jgi:hypothetical protein
LTPFPWAFVEWDILPAAAAETAVVTAVDALDMHAMELESMKGKRKVARHSL